MNSSNAAPPIPAAATAVVGSSVAEEGVTDGAAFPVITPGEFQTKLPPTPVAPLAGLAGGSAGTPPRGEPANGLMTAATGLLAGMVSFVCEAIFAVGVYSVGFAPKTTDVAVPVPIPLVNGFTLLVFRLL